MKHQENVKKWFETHDKPSEQQFYNFFKWIRWIDENISVQDIEGLNKLLIAKADKQAFNTHLQDEILHPSENDRENWNGKLDKTGTSVNSLKLGDKLPSYYVAKQDVYNKQESDNALLLAMNEVVQMLLNNPDLEINSIQELLSEMTTADNALVASIANKVSYVVPQNLTLDQKYIAQRNIGLLYHKHFSLQNQDARATSIKPSDVPLGFSPFFARQDLNNQSSYSEDYVDLLVMNGWSDTTGYKLNALSFGKNTKSIKLFQARKDSDAWEAPIEIITDDNIEDYLPTDLFLSLYGGTLSNDLTIQKSVTGGIGGKLKLINQAGSGVGHQTAIEFLGFIKSDGTRILSNPTGSYGNNPDLHFQVMKNGGAWVTNVTIKHSGELLVGTNEAYHAGNLPKQTVAPISSVTSYTAKASDIGSVVPLSNANAQIILNTASFPRIGDTAKYFYKGTGTCKVATSGTATELKNINDTLEFDGQNSMIEITKTGANEYFICGQLIRAELWEWQVV
ncbi:hypothetical protein F6A46_04110 [Tenacibaculum finnmarkense genomovar ulcerans]|uniref:hypothetical protein n=1 Tax=Tenacibaculum finnmarkense TaxID=2781243 RepID=UPI00187BA4BE|nr:hypothetical protein [Tenacibaculum finnmarkense]MBE7687421.1 hypothetical protein [Tenacibaculum finnmarkense genomovar ulcerans]